METNEELRVNIIELKDLIEEIRLAKSVEDRYEDVKGGMEQISIMMLARSSV